MTTKMNEESNEIFDPVTIKNIKDEVYHFVKKYCESYHISGSEYRLFLHNSHPIKFNKILIVEIERFHDNVLAYCKRFPYLISHLSHENSTEFVTTDRIVGMLDLQKTYHLRRNQPTNQVVCSTYAKNLFIPENVLLGAVILGINALATKFYEQKEEIKGFDENYHGKYLRDIRNYSNFLLRDRFVSKLTRYYFENYESFNQLAIEVNSRINAQKIHSKYKMLIKFILVWKKFDKILHDSHNSLRSALLSQIEFRDTSKLYEMWVFYKILEMFGGMEFTSNHKKFSNKKYSVEYQYSKHVGWIAEKERETNIFRQPDVVIKKDGKIIAIIDAKYMSSDKKYDPYDETKSQSTPDRNIVNQMIIYLDYGKNSDKSDLGIVLFADDRKNEPFVIKKEDNSKKLYFMNFHPENDIEFLSNKLKKILMV